MKVVISRGHEHASGDGTKDFAKRSRRCDRCKRVIFTRETVTNTNAGTTWLPAQVVEDDKLAPAEANSRIERNHRGFRVEAHRAASLSGEEWTYWSVFRLCDRREMTSAFSDDDAAWIVEDLCRRVDAYLAKPRNQRTPEDF